MVLIRKPRNIINSPFEKKASEDCEAVQRKIFKTWHEVMSYMQIETVELPWNSDGATALRILREKYGNRYKNINDSFLDEVVDAYDERSSQEQLAALGEAIQELGLRFCHLSLNPPHYTVFIVETDNTKDYLNKWKEVLTRRQFFNMIDTFAMRRDETLDRPSEDVKIPMSFVQVMGAQDAKYSREYVLDKIFFVVTYEKVERFNPEPIKQLRIYDLRKWPVQLLEAKLEFDREYIEPYTLTITADDGEYIYLGDDVERPRSWKKTYVNEKGQVLPIYDDEDEDKLQWRVLPIRRKKHLDIPEIEDAIPLFTIEDRIIYYYDNDDIDNRQSEENNGKRISLQKRRDQRKQRNTLLEYNTVTKCYRTLEFPGSAYINSEDLILYKDKWIIIPDSIFNRDASYILRLWNPETHECFRLTQKDMGCHNINQIILTESNDILILLDDGRLCRFDIDLSNWLKKDMQLHSVLLDNWQNEVRRSYENFPEETDKFVRLRRREASDRMLITFEDGRTYDILLKDNKSFIR